ncbi:hypothetical protein P7K49_016228, partial [Saguinus oedipus]
MVGILDLPQCPGAWAAVWQRVCFQTLKGLISSSLPAAQGTFPAFLPCCGLDKTSDQQVKSYSRWSWRSQRTGNISGSWADALLLSH